MTAVLMVSGLVLPWAVAGLYIFHGHQRQRLRARLARAASAYRRPAAEAEETSEEPARLEPFPWLSWILSRLGIRERLELQLRRMDINLTPGEFVATMITIWVAAPLATWALGQPPPIVGSVLVLALLAPQMVFSMRKAMRKKQFIAQLPDALDMISSSIRVGHGLQRALQLVAGEAENPMGSEMRRAMAEVALGHPVDMALHRTADRVQSRELELLANAVAIQMQIGGNMAEVIDRVGETLREREELQQEVKSLTAEGTMTAYVCIGMPPAMGLFVAYTNPDYMAPLIATSFGHILLGVTAFLQLMGALVIKRMMKLE
jgi:tight adherence protein B